MGVRVQISARLIRWPEQCACCLGRANEVYRATYTRVTGKKVIRTDSRWWDVPYCSSCLGHVDAASRAKAITATGAYTVLALGILLGLVVAAFGSCCCGPALFAPAQPRGENRGGASVGVVVAALGSVAAGIGVIAGASVWYRRLEADARRRKRRALQHAESLTSSHCCTRSLAVAYEGWSGTVHTFWFASTGYADAFVRANPGKILSR